MAAARLRLRVGAALPWLENEAGLEILGPAPEGMLQRWPMSKRVNSSQAPNDDETLTQPVNVDAPEPQV
jgi:hypothetical protein